MSLFKTGQFQSASSIILPWKVECDALTGDDWDWAACMIAQAVGHFGRAEGVPTGGETLAFFLNEEHATHGPLLIVDDVLTTGGSMERQRAGRDAIGFVVFARGPCPPWVRALWTFTG